MWKWKGSRRRSSRSTKSTLDSQNWTRRSCTRKPPGRWIHTASRSSWWRRRWRARTSWCRVCSAWRRIQSCDSTKKRKRFWRRGRWRPYDAGGPRRIPSPSTSATILTNITVYRPPKQSRYFNWSPVTSILSWRSRKRRITSVLRETRDPPWWRIACRHWSKYLSHSQYMLAPPSQVWIEVIIIIKRTLEQLSVLDETRARLEARPTYVHSRITSWRYFAYFVLILHDHGRISKTPRKQVCSCCFRF